jgi:biopolymer transport protein ExbB
MQDPTMLAAGVSQALITTAAGMIVAIPALVAYRYFQRRIIDINAQFETQAGLMIQELYDYQLLDNINSSAMSQSITHAAVDDKSSHVSNGLSIDTSDLNHTAAAT